MRRPRVHCLTNSVAQSFTANLLLAAGAIPSMTVAPEEIAHFVRRSARSSSISARSMPNAAPRFRSRSTRPRSAGVPVVLDPVFVDASPPRLALARDGIAKRPAILRLNGREFEAIAGLSPTPSHVREVARAQRCVVALTAATDIVSDGESMIGIRNGHPLMAQVTGMGCASGALIAALLASGGNPLRSAVAGLAAMGVAGEIAAETARGPGSFAVAILDALSALDGPMLGARARLETGKA